MAHLGLDEVPEWVGRLRDESGDAAGISEQRDGNHQPTRACSFRVITTPNGRPVQAACLGCGGSARLRLLSDLISFQEHHTQSCADAAGPVSDQTGRILSSWKEVARYIGKGVRTVQRWERNSGLPVRRPMAGCSAIIAYTEELDAWLKRVPTPEPEIEQLRAKVKELQAENENLRRTLTYITSSVKSA